MALLRLAELTPRDWEVKIIDERFEQIDYDAPADLVGITALTSVAPGAYRIADKFRKKGVPVVIGGQHASFMPYEALTHADSVACGEADEIWPAILSDVKNHRLKSRYQPDSLPALDLPVQRAVSHVRKTKFFGFLPYSTDFLFIQATRGCPFGCEFCSVTIFNGKEVRARSLKSIARTLIGYLSKYEVLVFVDDNIMMYPDPRELFSTLKQVGVKVWITQTDIRIGNADVVDAAVESGLAAVYVGLESIDPAILAGTAGKTKSAWSARYEENIKRLRENGVIVEAGFIFGSKTENFDTIKRTVEWAVRVGIDVVNFWILTPMPGTNLFQRMLNEKRIKIPDWTKYDGFNYVIEPDGCWNQETLKEGVRWAYEQFYSFSSIFKRGRRLPFLSEAAWLGANLGYRRFGA